MNKLTLMLAVYIVIGWGALIIQNPKPFIIKPSVYEAGQIMNISPSIFNDDFTIDRHDKLAAMYIASGREKDAINIFIDALKEDAGYDDNTIIKKSSLNARVNSMRFKRYLHTIDTLSIIFRLGERLKIPESEMTHMLSTYMKGIDRPETLQEYVVALEYRLSFRHLENIDKLFNQFKKYLHSSSMAETHPIKELPFLYYYPYFKGRFLLLNCKYNEAEQYLGLALKFRPDNSGLAYSDLVDVYLKMKQYGKARIVINSLLSHPRDTAEFMFFKSH